MSHHIPQRQRGKEEGSLNMHNNDSVSNSCKEDDVIFVQRTTNKRKVRYIQTNILRYARKLDGSPIINNHQLQGCQSLGISPTRKYNMSDNSEVPAKVTKIKLPVSKILTLPETNDIEKFNISSNAMESQPLEVPPELKGIHLKVSKISNPAKSNEKSEVATKMMESQPLEVLPELEKLHVSISKVISSTKSSDMIANTLNSSGLMDTQTLIEQRIPKRKLPTKSHSEPKRVKTEFNVSNQPRCRTKISFHGDADGANSHYLSDNELGIIYENKFSIDFDKENMSASVKRSWNEIRTASLVCPVLIRDPPIKNMKTVLNDAHILKTDLQFCTFKTRLEEIGEEMIQKYISAEDSNCSFAEFFLLSCLHCKFKTESRLVLRSHIGKRHKKWPFYLNRNF